MVRSPGKGVDEDALRAALVELRPTVAYVELVGVMPGQGQTSGSTFMVAWGFIRGVLVGLGIPYKLVAPIKWKNRILVAAGYPMGPPLPKEECPKGLKAAARRAWLKESGKRLAAAKKERKDAQKRAAVAFVTSKYPGINLIAPRGRVENHNLAEAVCLAAFGETEEAAHV